MSNLQEDLKKRKPTLGTKSALRKIRRGEVSKIYVASNYTMKDDLIRLAKSNGIEVVIGGTSKELGTICKKTFSVSVISFE